MSPGVILLAAVGLVVLSTWLELVAIKRHDRKMRAIQDRHNARIDALYADHYAKLHELFRDLGTCPDRKPVPTPEIGSLR